MEENKKRSNILSWILLAFAGTFMIFLFAPLEAYYSNRSEYWFEVKELLPIILICFIAAFAICALLGFIFNKTKIGLPIYAFLLSLLVYLYIQGNYVPRNYGVLDGKTVDFGAYKSYGIISIIFIILAVALWIAAWRLLKDKTFKYGKYICIFIVLIQLITIGTLAISGTMEKSGEEGGQKKWISTDEGLFEFSEDDNLIVVLCDTFDSSFAKEALSGPNGQEYSRIMDGFTYYPDTVGLYPTTKGAIPCMLTGKVYYNDMRYNDFVKQAYEDNSFYKELKDKNYSIMAYTQETFLNPEAVDYRNVYEGTYKISDPYLFGRKIYKLVAFNYAPHQLKKHFLLETGEFDKFKVSPYGERGQTGDMMDFHQKLQNEEVSLLTDENRFSFIHIDGTHPPYTFDKDLKSEEGKSYTYYDETEGTFKELEMFFEKLKKAGIYDTSSIIVLADHGSVGYSQNPSLFIKNKKEQGDLKTRYIPLSYLNINDIMKGLVAGEKVDDAWLQRFVTDAPRPYLFYSWDNTWKRDYLPGITEYLVTGTADDLEKIIITDTEYIGTDQDFSYELGKEIIYSSDVPGNTYWVSGGAMANPGGRWSNGYKAVFKFDLTGQEYNDLKVVIKYSRTCLPEERVNVFADSSPVAELVAAGEGELVFTVPHELVKEDILTLNMDLPDAAIPANITEGSTDFRTLAIFVNSITVESVE